MTPLPESGSFRDRTSRVFFDEKRFYRSLNPQAWEDWKFLSQTKFFGNLMQLGKVVPTREAEQIHLPDIPLGQDWAGVLEHERIPFVSYPYEWCFGMLKDAGLLQLEILEAAIAEGMILKDSSAFNIQWQGSSPVFIDIGSFTRMGRGETWVGYKQFCEMFLFPLMVQAYKQISFNTWLRGNIDGIPAEDCRNLMSMRDLFRPGVLAHVLLQAIAQKRFHGSSAQFRKELQEAGFHKELILNNVRALRKLLRKLKWAPKTSTWSDYAETHSYHEVDFKEKMNFVESVAKQRKWLMLWDVGCNTGHFTRIAAEHADHAVAMDIDPLVIEKFYGELKSEGNKKILPLIVNIANPSGNIGWRADERKTLDRRGKPDLTLCLALIHHVAISSNIPVNAFLEWLSSLETDIIIEFVSKDDPMVKILLKNKDDIYNDYEETFFETCLKKHFAIEKKQEVKKSQRILYYAKKIY